MSVDYARNNSSAAAAADLHHDSTSSSSSNCSPTETEAPSAFPVLFARVVETQRCFPIVGWATSCWLVDPPNFYPFVPRHGAAETPAMRAFWSDFCEVNHSSQWAAHANGDTSRGSNALELLTSDEDAQKVAVFPLEYTLPAGYAWDGFWEVSTHHPRGTTSLGWRYGPFFHETPQCLPGTPTHTPHFKRTQTPACTVRRRVWQRHVVCLNGPTAPTSADAYSEASLTDEEEAREAYLRDKCEEMRVAERLKARKLAVLLAGENWTTDDDLRAEEELRTFVKGRFAQESATLRNNNNPSFANPFQSGMNAKDSDSEAGPQWSPNSEDALRGQHGDPYAEPSFGNIGGAVAASSWAVDSQVACEANHITGASPTELNKDHFVTRAAMEESNLKLLFNNNPELLPEGLVSTSEAPSSPIGGSTADGADLVGHPTVDTFVAASPNDEDEITDDPSMLQGGGVLERNATDFDSIFQKFVSNPETMD